jgi:glycosyltransferase involved in cell wall biosynthesis
MDVKNLSADIIIPYYKNLSALSALSCKIESWVSTYPLVNVFVVVDDGSPNQDFELPDVIAKKSRVTVIRHSENRGRAAALNTGIRAGSSELVVFLDVDCSPQEGWLYRFFLGAESGADCIFGNLRADGMSYWSRYLNELYARKASAYLKGGRDFNTPFCMFRRELLNQVGGFNEEYVCYGFEDRDLIQNLINSVGISPLFLADVYAAHSPPNSVKGIMTKATESGEFSARIFSRRFPACYRNTGYWFFDACEHSMVYCFPLAVMWKLIDKNVFAVKTLMDKESLPYLAWKWLVKLSSGLAFFHGTYRSKK